MAGFISALEFIGLLASIAVYMVLTFVLKMPALWDGAPRLTVLAIRLQITSAIIDVHLAFGRTYAGHTLMGLAFLICASAIAFGQIPNSIETYQDVVRRCL